MAPPPGGGGKRGGRCGAAGAALRAEAARAREHAAAAQRRAEHASGEAAARVAAAERARAEAERAAASAEQRVQGLEALLAERDAQIGEVAAAYERRLAGLRARLADHDHGELVSPGTENGTEAVGEAAPLFGRRVLVIGDAPRAAAYRVCALSLGAARVDFVEGMDQAPGARIEALVSSADVVALITAHCKHSTCETARKCARRAAGVVTVPVAGMRAFREALCDVGGRGRLGAEALRLGC